MTGTKASSFSKNLSAVALALCLSLAAAACGEKTRSLAERSVERAQAANDTLARNLTRAPCAISLGSYYRTLSASDREALDLLCGGVRRGLVRVEATDGAGAE